MTKFGHLTRVAAMCAVVLFLAAAPAATQVVEVATMPPAQGVGQRTHHLILQVNSDEPAMMTLALNGRQRRQYYKNLGERWRSRSSPSAPACIC